MIDGDMEKLVVELQKDGKRACSRRNQRGVTIGEALRDASVRLEAVGGTGRLDAVFLLAHAGGVSRAEMIAHRERELTPDVAERFLALVEQRARGTPLAYVTGEAGFYGRMFGVDERVLVPRPETELAIEWAVRHLRAIGRENGSAADIGTGSGAIAVTLACELRELSVYASDVSQRGADGRAPQRRAQQRLSARDFLHGDLAAPLLPYAPFDCVVANLPYVPTAECAGAPDPVSFEPLLARDGGARRLVALPPPAARFAARSSRRAASRSSKRRRRTRGCSNGSFATRCRTRVSRRSAIRRPRPARRRRHPARRLKRRTVAKLYFRYSAMNAGKSTSLLQVAHNYEEQGFAVQLYTAAIDHRYGYGVVASRLGPQRNSSTFDAGTDFEGALGATRDVACVLIDEAQFLAPAQVRQLHRVADRPSAER